MYSLADFKERLFSGDHPLLYSLRSVPTEAAFLQTFFPPEFCSQVFYDADHKAYSMKNLLTDPSQRNKIFNRRYTGYAHIENLYGVLTASPGLWEIICTNCRNELSKASGADELCVYILDLLRSDVENEHYRSYVMDHLESDLAAAFAATIIYLLLCGNVDDRIVDCFSPAVQAEQVSDYLDRTCAMLSYPFECDSVSEFPHLVEEYFDDYSALFSHITEIQTGDRRVESDSPLHTLYDRIIEGRSEKLLTISGAAGTGKTAITQLLFMRLVCDVRSGRNTSLLPCYVSLNHYLRSFPDDPAALTDAMSEDFRYFADLCAKQPERTPVVFVDGVKSFIMDISDAEYHLNGLLNKLNKSRGRKGKARLVTSVEHGVARNPGRHRATAAFASGQYACTVRVNALHLADKARTAAYLDKFLKIYPSDTKGQITERLAGLGIKRIDTHQLRLLITRLWDAGSISDLYEMLCLDYLDGNRSEMLTAAQWAFSFVCTGDSLPPLRDLRLRELLCAHESIQEYFVALWYIDRIKNDSIKDNLSLFDMIMPKGVTQFMVPMLNRSAADEGRLIELIEREYDNMGLLAKSEMTYLMGRIKSPGLSDRARQLLEKNYDRHKAELAAETKSDPDYRRRLFLLRGISVSLIVKGRMDISREYITSLIHNHLANEINRGFHLEYYGDKAYLPAYDTLDFKDDTRSGNRTLDYLISDNEQSMRSGALPPIFELNLFTICSLMQSRIGLPPGSVSINMPYYLSKAVDHAKWYLSHSPGGDRVFTDYLRMAIRDLSDPTGGTVEAKAYSTYCRRVMRSGWVKRGIGFPESVAEHTYHAWLMGMMFLPDALPEYQDYSKERILRLLLIHDAAESVTGDIPRPDKAQDQDFFDRSEDEEMGIFLSRGSYPGIASMQDFYDLWKLWRSDDDINGRIAREIDVIQCLYQLLEYVNLNPDCFEEVGLRNWLSEYTGIKTAPGKNILHSVVFGNPEFADTLKRFGII